MNILVIGIPDSALMETIVKKYPQLETIYVTESRPFEQDVSAAFAQLIHQRTNFTLITDNMIGSAMQNGLISAVYVQGEQNDCNEWRIIAGGAIGVIVATEHKIPFHLYKKEFPHRACNCFFDTPIVPEGVSCIDCRNDTHACLSLQNSSFKEFVQ